MSSAEPSLPGASRRRVLKGAAWTAPAIVLATGAPAVAASGPALVTTTATGDRFAVNLGVSVTFSNANTGSTGPTTIAVRLTPAGGTVSGNPSNVPPSFQFTGVSDDGGARTYVFQTAGIPGTASAASPPVNTELSFLVSAANNTTGSILVTTTPTTGTVAPGTGAWVTSGGGLPPN